MDTIKGALGVGFFVGAVTGGLGVALMLQPEHANVLRGAVGLNAKTAPAMSPNNDPETPLANEWRNAASDRLIFECEDEKGTLIAVYQKASDGGFKKLETRGDGSVRELPLTGGPAVNCGDRFKFHGPVRGVQNTVFGPPLT